MSSPDRRLLHTGLEGQSSTGPTEYRCPFSRPASNSLSRRISIPVQVETDDTGQPAAFTWRGVRRRVEVIGYWHLRDRWWVSRAEADRSGKGFSDRHYYRLLTIDHQVFEVYRELTSAGLWILDVVQD